MKLHVLVEGTSERGFFEPWAARLLRGHTVKVYPHQGKGNLPTSDKTKNDSRKRGLLDQLPAKLRAFGKSFDSRTDRVVVIVDADNENPDALTARLQRLLAEISPAPKVLFCIAVEELEAFYLGDLKGLKRAYPDHNQALARKYQPDSICGTWEYFGGVIRDGGGNKVDWADAMGPVVTTLAAHSRSPSFRALVTGLGSFITLGPPSVGVKKRRVTPRDSARRKDGKR